MLKFMFWCSLVNHTLFCVFFSVFQAAQQAAKGGFWPAACKTERTIAMFILNTSIVEWHECYLRNRFLLSYRNTSESLGE